MNDEVQNKHDLSPEYLAYYGEEPQIATTLREHVEMWSLGIAWGVLLPAVGAYLIVKGIIWLESLSALIH